MPIYPALGRTESKVVRQYLLSTETLVPAPLEEVFSFFSKAENLEQITPSFLRFRVTTPLPLEMKTGARIAYRLVLFGIPMIWESEITAWEPGVRFVDEQLRGPYKKWVHEHRFVEEDGQTRMFDRVEYSVPGGPLAPLAHLLFVGWQVRLIFNYREDAIRKHFGA